jgi:hypothetical protein
VPNASAECSATTIGRRRSGDHVLDHVRHRVRPSMWTLRGSASRDRNVNRDGGETARDRAGIPRRDSRRCVAPADRSERRSIPRQRNGDGHSRVLSTRRRGARIRVGPRSCGTGAPVSPFQWRWVSPVSGSPPWRHGRRKSPLTRTPPPQDRKDSCPMDHLLVRASYERRVPTLPASGAPEPRSAAASPSWTRGTSYAEMVGRTRGAVNRECGSGPFS